MSRDWFTVDRAGLVAIAKRRGMAFVVTEPVQNAWDEQATRVELTLRPVPNRALVEITVTDDSPDGFRDIADSYMMFRESYKVGNPEQRGRFNVGEKLLLAMAEMASVTSTTGCVVFGPAGRTTSRRRTDRGSVLHAHLRMTRAELDEALAFTRCLIPPSGIATFVNGEQLPSRTPLRSAERSLETEMRGPEGGFRYTVRTAPVSLYAPLPGEEPHLYEIGIPIDQIACPWHVDVGQKIPLSLDRSSVRVGYARSVMTAVAEMMADAMAKEQARAAWVLDSLAAMEDDQAVRDVVKKRFGTAVIYDPSDPEANKRAIDAGYHVVRGGEMDRMAWSAVRRAEALQPAGRLFSTRVRTGPDGREPEPRERWTADMEAFASYAAAMAEHVLDGHQPAVEFYRNVTGFRAFCGGGVIGFNLGAGGEKLLAASGYTDEGKALDQLLIHELAHVAAKDHLTDEFHRECCRIGACLRSFYDRIDDHRVAAQGAPDPEIF